VTDAAQYAIDIAASVSGGDATAAQLNALADRMSHAGVNAGFLDDAMLRVTRDLDQATAASTAAAAALAGGNREYDRLAQAAERAGQQAERAAAKNRGIVPPHLQSALAAANQALSEQAAKLRVLESTAEQAADAQQRLSRTSRSLGNITARTNARLGDSATNLSTFRGALGDIGGPLGDLGERVLGPAQAFADLREKFGAATAAGAVFAVGAAAVAAALAVVAAAAAAAVGALLAYGIGVANSARSAGLLVEAQERMHPELVAARGAIASLSSELLTPKDRLRSLATSFTEAGVSAADLPRALRAAALAESALGQGGADQFVDSIKTAKLTVDEFAATAERDFGGIVARQMLSLESQGARLQRNFSGLFAGLNPEPVLVAFARIVDLFGEGTATGRFLKAVFEGLLQPLIDKAPLVALYFEALFLGLAIGALKAYIALKPIIASVTKLLGIDTGSWDLETVLAGVAVAGQYLAIGLLIVVAVLAVLGAAFLGIVAIQLIVVAAFWSLVVGVALALTAVGRAIGGAIGAMVASVRKLGQDIMAGLAAGIGLGKGGVVDSITGAVGGAIKAAKAALGIASPSKVFMSLGGYTAEGFAAGVDDGADDAQTAMSDMVEPPAVGGSTIRAAGSAASVGGGGGGVNLSGATFNFYGVEGAENAEIRFGEILTRILEGDALQLTGATA
jgi:hypothetical protein